MRLKTGWAVKCVFIRAPVVVLKKYRLDNLFNNKNMLNWFRLSRNWCKILSAVFYHLYFHKLIRVKQTTADLFTMWSVAPPAALSPPTPPTSWGLSAGRKKDKTPDSERETLFQSHVDFVTLCFYMSPHLFFSLLNSSCVLSECISEACHGGFKAYVDEMTLKCHDEVQVTAQKAPEQLLSGRWHEITSYICR